MSKMIAVTMGDPAGIGPEIIIKSLAEGALSGAPVVVAPSSSHQLELDLRPRAPLAVRLEPPKVGLYRWTPEDGIACHFSHVQAFDGPFPI